MYTRLTEESVRRKAFQPILGPDIYNNVDNLLCSNFSSMTSDLATQPKPDYLEGATITDVHPVVHSELQSVIFPYDYGLYEEALTAPNLVVELKSRSGSQQTAQLQVAHEGAYCGRAMHALDRWRRAADDPWAYNGTAYAYSAIYMDGTGTLEMYSHHIEVMANGELRYHMTMLDVIVLALNKEEFVRGITAFRNLRDMAAERRDAIIEAANARVE